MTPSSTPSLEEVFHRIHANKKQQREIRAMYKDALDNSPEYKKILEELDELKKKKRDIENEAREGLGKELQDLDLLKLHVKADNEMLSDMALNKYVAGESIELKDAYDQVYEPVFSVKFVKGNTTSK